MTILLPALAISFAAFCVWLTVRIINRRERWAKWTLAAVLGLPLLYVLGFGPACWIATRYEPLRGFVNSIYCPAAWAYFKSPDTVGCAIIWYANAGGDVNFYGTELGGFRLKFLPDMKQDDLPPPLPPSR